MAMLGRIMPAPLLIPVMVTGTPPISIRRLNALGRVSVVMMPSAARTQWSCCASPMAAGKPASMRSTGRGSMITPVEKGSTCAGCKPSNPAAAALVARARARPSWPVPALALPVLITMARTPFTEAAEARCSRHTCTGAAQKRLRVKTPATAVPSSSRNTVRSLRPTLRIPASATPMRTPGTPWISAGSGAARWTGMGHFQKWNVDYPKNKLQTDVCRK